MLTEEEIDRLFKRAWDLGYTFDVRLLGEDSIVPIGNPRTKELDTRLSDIEHVIHELAHCALFDIPLAKLKRRDLTMKWLDRIEKKTPKEAQERNEIEAFAVTMAVLDKLGVQYHVQDFRVALYDIQISGNYDHPEDLLETFPSDPRGVAAIELIYDIFTNWSL